MPENPPTLARIDVLAESCDLHPITIRRAISAGELPAFKIGKALRVREDDFATWLETKRVPSANAGPARRAKAVRR